MSVGSTKPKSFTLNVYDPSSRSVIKFALPGGHDSPFRSRIPDHVGTIFARFEDQMRVKSWHFANGSRRVLRFCAPMTVRMLELTAVTRKISKPICSKSPTARNVASLKKSSRSRLRRNKVVSGAPALFATLPFASGTVSVSHRVHQLGISKRICCKDFRVRTADEIHRPSFIPADVAASPNRVLEHNSASRPDSQHRRLSTRRLR